MNGYKPIPGESAMDLPEDDLTSLASERASNILAPYGEKFGLKPIVSPSQSPMATPGAGLEDKLYQAVHPDTFQKVLEMIMQMVTGKPIPSRGGEAEAESRQGGGPVYVVGEKGPEFLEMYPEGGGYVHPIPRQEGGEVSTGLSSPSQWFEKSKQSIRDPVGWLGGQARQFTQGWPTGVGAYESPYEPGLPGFKMPEGGGGLGLGKVLREAPGVGGEIYRGIFPEAPTTPPGPPAGYEEARRQRREQKPIPTAGAGPTGLGPTGLSRGTDWMSYGPGISYAMGPERFFAGGREVERGTPGAMSGDVMARERLMRETPRMGEGAFYQPPPGPGKGSYWDVHPEERRAQEIYDMLRGPSPDSYEAGVEKFRESNLRDILADPTTTHEARVSAGEQLRDMQLGRIQRDAVARKSAAEIYGGAMQYGPGSPEAQEKLAHAEYMRQMPWAHLAGISEEGRTHLEGINRQVAGHIAAAKIAAEVKDPIMKEIGAVLSQGQKMAEISGIPFDPQAAIAQVLNVYKAIGGITPEQWNALPAQYKPPMQGARWGRDPKTAEEGWYIADPTQKGKWKIWKEPKG